MRKSVIYLEGGGDSSALHTRCQEGFNKLLRAMGFAGKMPRLVACGGRAKAFDRFNTAVAQGQAAFVGLWIDSEDPVDLLSSNPDTDWDEHEAWDFLNARDGWSQPDDTEDKQVLLMVTCMESWIVADRPTLQEHYGSNLNKNQLPALHDLENRNRHTVQDALERATSGCSNAYKKGDRSFMILGKLNPDELEKHLGSFGRVKRILNKVL